MEILFVSHKHPPAIGGMEKQSAELISHMKQYARVHSIVYAGQGSRLWFLLSLRKKIIRTCKKNPGIQLIHFNDGLVAAFCIFHKGYSHLKKAVTLHGLDVVFPNSIYQRYILPAFNRFDLIIAVSEATAKACIQRGIKKEKIRVVPNGVDTSLASTRAITERAVYIQSHFGIKTGNRPILIAMGRAVQRKGFSWFIKNVLPMLDNKPLLLIIGPFSHNTSFTEKLISILPSFLRKQVELFTGMPTDEKQLRTILQQPSAYPNAIHLGKLPFEQITQLLAMSDAFVMPNINVDGDMEGFGLVCLEASLCGTIVFAADSGGIGTAIKDGYNGTLLPAGDAHQWQKALNRFLEDPSIYKEQVEKARLFTYQYFGWGLMARSYRDYFINICIGEQKIPQHSELVSIDQVNTALQ